MTPQERERLTGVGNGYAACGADFEGTVRMVADARRLEPAEVKQRLAETRARCGTEAEFVRRRLPAEFPP